MTNVSAQCTNCVHAKGCPFAHKVNVEWTCPYSKDVVLHEDIVLSDVKPTMQERLYALKQQVQGASLKAALQDKAAQIKGFFADRPQVVKVAKAAGEGLVAGMAIGTAAYVAYRIVKK